MFSIQEAMPLVKDQLKQLWKPIAIQQFFQLLLSTNHSQIGCISPNRQGSQSKETKSIFAYQNLSFLNFFSIK